MFSSADFTPCPGKRLSFLTLGFVSDEGKAQLPLAGSTEYEATGAGPPDPAAAGPRGPGPHDHIPPNKPPWFDQPHPVTPWGQQQVLAEGLGYIEWEVFLAMKSSLACVKQRAGI